MPVGSAVRHAAPPAYPTTDPPRTPTSRSGWPPAPSDRRPPPLAAAVGPSTPLRPAPWVAVPSRKVVLVSAASLDGPDTSATRFLSGSAERHCASAPGGLLPLVPSPAATRASAPVAAPPRERQPGALASHRGSGRQQAHRRLPQPRNSRTTSRSALAACCLTAPQDSRLANLESFPRGTVETCIRWAAVRRVSPRAWESLVGLWARISPPAPT